MSLTYTEISRKHVGRGTNVNVAAIPANRFCGFTTSTAYDDPIDLMSVAGAAHAKGVTSHAIQPGDTGDVHTEGVVPVESDGTGAIAAGDELTVNVTAGATDGRVLKANPVTGVNAQIVGRAMTPAAATAGAIVMVEIARSVMQGQ